MSRKLFERGWQDKEADVNEEAETAQGQEDNANIPQDAQARSTTTDSEEDSTLIQKQTLANIIEEAEFWMKAYHGLRFDDVDVVPEPDQRVPHTQRTRERINQAWLEFKTGELDAQEAQSRSAWAEGQEVVHTMVYRFRGRNDRRTRRSIAEQLQNAIRSGAEIEYYRDKVE